MEGGGESPYDEFGYIKDGKLFHLDGINKGGDATAWTDLLGGVKFTYTEHSIAYNDGVYFDGRGYILGDDIPSVRQYDYTLCTLEVVYQVENNNAYQFVFGCGSYNVAFGCGKGTSYTSTGSHAFYKGEPSLGVYVVSMNEQRQIRNGVQMEILNNDWWNVNNVYSIGGRTYGSASYYKGKVMSIRIYNRHLTAEEILHNQQVDNIRFNLGLSL